jgi:hypothetical protein
MVAEKILFQIDIVTMNRKSTHEHINSYTHVVLSLKMKIDDLMKVNLFPFDD